ncbi:MAG TPA: C-GCAxxG-C-C family protein [Anaerolineae bacterium]|nr:C-GCAxxG-C-C family protein [Anaerolineae bacterium]
MTKDVVERALSAFDEGFSCSQSVFSAFAPELELDREMALRVATAFGGGMGHRGDTCGAVTGALMAIGLKHGRVRAEDREIRDLAYSLVNRFAEEFEARHGSIVCRELLGFDLSTPEGERLAEERWPDRMPCRELVRDAAKILEEML